MLKAIVVDDEKISRDVLKGYLGKYCPSVHFSGEADNKESAQALIARVNPDLVFLDIEMPYGTGFDLLEEIEEPAFETIFVTAFSEYGMQAINASAAYYLLKPIKIDELIQAVAGVEDTLTNKNKINRAQILTSNLKYSNTQHQRIVLPTMQGFDVVKVSDVMHCQADDNFTQVHLSNGDRKLVCRPLKHFDQILGELEFQRVHKSHLINLLFVTSYSKGKTGSVELKGGTTVPISASKKEAFLKYFVG